MGGSSYSDHDYSTRTADRVARGAPVFAHSAAVAAGRASGCHPTLDVSDGQIRESRDSPAHPESVAIGVIFDVTGSMGGVPIVLQKKIPNLMGLLLKNGYVKDPQILFGAVGDAISDNVALQIGQFESGLEMDDNLTNIYLEGGGGGTYEESYQNALYYFAHRTSIDCFEKRGKKGYLFVIGDEKPYPVSKREELSRLMGVKVEADVPLADIVKAAQEKYEVFFVIPNETTHYKDPVLRETWAKLLGSDHVLMLEKPEAVCEAIGLAIGILEGTTGDDLSHDLKKAGADGGVIHATTSALDGLAKNAMVRAGTASGAIESGSAARSTANERL
jgi:hypothetical protein